MLSKPTLTQCALISCRTSRPVAAGRSAFICCFTSWLTAISTQRAASVLDYCAVSVKHPVFVSSCTDLSAAVNVKRTPPWLIVAPTLVPLVAVSMITVPR